MASSQEDGDELVARPPIDTSRLETLLPDRFDHYFLYRESNTNDYRYRLTVVDRSSWATSKLNHATAVVLIPAGRESEYVFGTRTGLLSVAESAGCARLIAVAFGRHHEFDSQSAVQEELTYIVQVLGQQGRFLPHSKRQPDDSIPFMALDGVGSRNVLAEGDTLLSGPFLVEQVKAGDTVVRRLYFMSNPFVIQSEVAMVDDEVVDKTHVSFEYHKTMAAGLLALAASRTQGVVIGLGGGGLVNFLRTILPSCHITVIELDPSVVTVAEKYFGFQRNDRTEVRVGDGLLLVSSDSVDETDADAIVMEPASQDFIAVDVDSKDTTVGMSCPPQSFVQVPYLTRLKALLNPDGWLIMNVSARDPAMFEMVKKNVRTVFGSAFSSDDSSDREDVNVVVFASASNVKLPPSMVRIDALHTSLGELEISESLSESWQTTVSELEDGAASLRALGETQSTGKSKKRTGGKRKKGKRK